ncbi:MAG: hypothetical protein WKF87_06575 [Chryseolinea sp.]
MKALNYYPVTIEERKAIMSINRTSDHSLVKTSGFLSNLSIMVIGLSPVVALVMYVIKTVAI